MQAITILFAEQGRLTLAEKVLPLLGDREIKIRVRASGINRADLLQRRGLYPPPPGVPLEIPGLECAGEVCEVGTQVELFRPGDRVMALLAGAGQAEYVVVDERLALPVPGYLSWAEAAAIPEAFATAYDALFLRAHWQSGETVLIHAVGSGVGSAALQIAALSGATIYGTASRAKLDKALALGLTVGIDYSCENFCQVIGSREPQGVPVILDLLGAAYWQQNIHCLRQEGRLVLIGLLSGAKLPADTSLAPLLAKRVSVIGTVLRSRPLEQKIALIDEIKQKLLPLFANRCLQPIVDRTFPASQAEEAYQYVEDRHNFGKVILLW